MSTSHAATTEVGIHARVTLQRAEFTLDVDLQLPGRGFIAVFGSSGCGKTTLLRVLAGLERARPGHVRVGAAVWQDDTTGVWVPTHQRALGYVFQEASLFDHLSVRANIAYGQKRARAAAHAEARSGAGTVERTIDLLGISHLLDRHTATLSGGERQRVAIARALAAQPRVLLMDEPLAALDAARKAEVLPYLEALQRTLDIPVLYVSHAPDEVARLATHLVLLEAGKVRASGSFEQLVARLDLPMAQGDAAATIIDGVLTHHDPTQHLSTVAFAGGDLLVSSSAERRVGQKLRLRIQARDVSLTLEHQQGTSILNILPVMVTELREDSPGQWMVALDAGGARVLARITQRSLQQMGLAPGMTVYAQIKGIALLN